MPEIVSMLQGLCDDQSGMTTVEYALLLALLTMGAFVAFGELGGTKMQLTAGAVARYMGN